MTLSDTKSHYGLISRVLHWGMAWAIMWQFLSASAHYFLEDTALEAFFWPTHKPLGVLLLVLMVLRLVWALINRSKRPHSVSTAAKLGHGLLYLLLIITPAIALIRQYGSGRSFEVWGIQVFAGFDRERIDWMLDLGSKFHGELGWVLLLLIVGHIGMAFIHKKYASKPNVLPRMWK